jgi:putative DNA primase/helicase
LWNGNWQGNGWNSQSDADLALANMLAFYTGKDAHQMDELFRQSGLYRQKWDRKTGDTTYGRLTIERAIADTKEVPTPHLWTYLLVTSF